MTNKINAILVVILVWVIVIGAFLIPKQFITLMAVGVCVAVSFALYLVVKDWLEE